ncbi:MAG TPA: hypothetical protein VGL93_10810 [Streptosporangiaceae bacterium]|jgi:hypothetical protein
MELTQTIRDSTVVDHAKVAAQNKRKVFVVQLRDNAYDDPGSYARTGFAKIIEEIEEVGWRLDEISPSQTKAGDIAHLLLFRPAPEEPAPQQAQPDATQRVDNTQPPSYPQQHYGQSGQQYQQGYQQQDPYAGQQYQTGGQQYYQQQPQQQYPPAAPQYPQAPPPPPPQYPGYGQPGW